jgi:glycosyltransferase involved in cell wall biosynthesis
MQISFHGTKIIIYKFDFLLKNYVPASHLKGNIVFLADKRSWAFDFVARSVARRLRPKWRCTVAYSDELPNLNPKKIDLLYLFFWGYRYQNLGFKKNQIIKEVASYRWMTEERFGRLSLNDFISRYLDDAQIVTTPCAALCNLLSTLRKDVFHCPNGIEPSLFNAHKRKRGKFTLIWAGNALDPGKGLKGIIIPAIGTDYKLIIADGKYSRFEMRKLYRTADVVIVTSNSESQPLPLIEAMACGCYPVATNVGVVPELVENGFNGLILPKRTSKDLRDAVDWCAAHLDYVRTMGDWNAFYAEQYRSWDKLVSRFDDIFKYALNKGASCEEKNCPDIFSLHPLPSLSLANRPKNYHSENKFNIDLAKLLLQDLWNSIRFVRFLSKTLSRIKRKIAVYGVLKSIAIMFYNNNS